MYYRKRLLIADASDSAFNVDIVCLEMFVLYYYHYHHRRRRHHHRRHGHCHHHRHRQNISLL